MVTLLIVIGLLWVVSLLVGEVAHADGHFDWMERCQAASYCLVLAAVATGALIIVS